MRGLLRRTEFLFLVEQLTPEQRTRLAQSMRAELRQRRQAVYCLRVADYAAGIDVLTRFAATGRRGVVAVIIE